MGYNAQLGLFDSPSAAQRQNALAILGRFGLADRADVDFGTLSQGQKQLVLLARSMVQEAPVMLMDEPDSALDFTNRHHMLRLIRDSIHSQQRCGLITLHDRRRSCVSSCRCYMARWRFCPMAADSSW